MFSKGRCSFRKVFWIKTAWICVKHTSENIKHVCFFSTQASLASPNTRSWSQISPPPFPHCFTRWGRSPKNVHKTNSSIKISEKPRKDWIKIPRRVGRNKEILGFQKVAPASLKSILSDQSAIWGSHWQYRVTLMVAMCYFWWAGPRRSRACQTKTVVKKKKKVCTSRTRCERKTLWDHSRCLGIRIISLIYAEPFQTSMTLQKDIQIQATQLSMSWSEIITT